MTHGKLNNLNNKKIHLIKPHRPSLYRQLFHPHVAIFRVKYPREAETIVSTTKICATLQSVFSYYLFNMLH